MSSYLIAPILIFTALLLWVGMTHAARLFAFKHPELGAAREEGGECGISCGCKNQDRCPTRLKNLEQENPRTLKTTIEEKGA